MTEQEVKENLCYYDSRNPDCVYDEDEIKDYNEYLKKKNKTCSCDNCFYGRDELANELLKYVSNGA